MVERTLTISQARNLLRLLTERSQAHLVATGRESFGIDIGPEIAPENGPVTQRLLEIVRSHSEDTNPKLKLRLFRPDEDIAVGKSIALQKPRKPSEEEALESRAQEVAKALASDAEDVSDAPGPGFTKSSLFRRLTGKPCSGRQ